MDSFDMSKNIMIKNVTSFPVGFRKISGEGEVNIPPYTSILISRSEVVSKVQSRSTLFWGETQDGKHPWIYIDDKETRIYTGLETETEPQSIIDEKKISDAFGLKNMSAFKKAIEELAVTFAEKKMLVEAVSKLNFNDYKKIKFIEEYTGMTVEN